MTTHDVAVVGAGVVGAALAGALGRAGFDVVLVDRQSPPRAPVDGEYDLRVYALSPASVRLLRELGAWERLDAGRVAAYSAMRVWGDDSQAALRFDAADVRARELGWIVEQDRLLAALWLSLHGATAVTGAVASMHIDEQRATLALADGREIHARLVVAADGADSPLRDRAGIDVAGWSYPQRAIVCHVRTEQPHGGAALQRFLPTGPLAFLPLADGRSSIVWSTTDHARLLALDDGAFCVELGAALQLALGEVMTTTRRASFPLRMLHAQAYVRERFALAGDAAHVVHPLAGQGVNLGLADVAALAATLAGARESGRDVGALRVLRRYERARRADNLDMIAVTDGLYRLFGTPLPGLDRLIDAGLEALDRLALPKRKLIERALGKR